MPSEPGKSEPGKSEPAKSEFGKPVPGKSALALGMLLPFGPGLVSGPFLRDFAAILESESVDSVWAVEHVVVRSAVLAAL